VHKIKLISLAVWFTLTPLAAGAAGLGKLTVISGLGEPLNAEVELLSTTKDELSSLTAQIAPNETFSEQGLERASILSAVRIDVSQRPNGTPVLKLSSSQPINDPFLDMLIQVEWSSGRLLREYTALLDPPGYNGGQSANAPAAQLPSTKSQTAPAVPGSSSETLPRKGKAHGTSTSKASEPAMGAQGGEHVVQKGDTLHAIAAQSQMDGISLEQMLVGLYRANKDAFAGNNMNRLKVGQIIRVPDQAELQSVSQQEAAKEIRVQTANWNAYRSKLAGIAESTAPGKEESSSQVASGKISAPAEDKSAAPAPGPRDVVKLSKSESAAAAKTDQEAAKRISALQEDAIAREKALKEADSRVASLEKQLQDMQKLLDLKSKALAEAQNGAKPPEAAVKEQLKPAPAPEPKAETPPTPPVAAPEAPKPEVQPGEPKPKKIVRPVPAPALPEPSLIDTVLDNPLFLAAGGGGLIALLGGAWLLMRNKRKKGLDSFEQGILTTGGLKSNTVFGNTVGGTVDTGTTSFLTDFGQGANAGMIDTNDVDPIAEAEVYMAYGRDVQAEEILKDAISKDPKRYELHLKLLEIFAHRKDTAAFETLAGELYAAVGASDPMWAKAAELGRALDSANPLYGSVPEAAAVESPTEPVDFEATMIQQAPAAPTDDLELGVGNEGSTLDFSLDAPEENNAQETPEVDNTLDFDLGSLETPAETPVAESEESLPDLNASLAELDADLAESAPPAPNEPQAETGAGLDFEFDLPEPAVEENAQLDVADLGMDVGSESTQMPEATDDNVAEISLDLPDLEMPALETPAGDAAESVSESGDSVEQTEEPAADLAMPDFELPSLDAVEETVADDAADEDAAATLDLSALELPESLTEPLAAEVPAEDEPVELEFPGTQTAVEEVSLEAPVVDVPESAFDIDLGAVETPATIDEQPAATSKDEEDGLDFNFDVDLGDLDAAPAAIADAPAAPLPDLDLSNIDLDVGGADSGAATEEITLSAATESPDVDTKLDLVTAYIDMGDNEGARELLEEVLKEGGPTQRERAQKLLSSID